MNLTQEEKEKIRNQHKSATELVRSKKEEMKKGLQKPEDKKTSN